MQARRRSVLRRSLPKLFIHEFVRSTTQRPSVWTGVFVPRLLMRGLISRSARAVWTGPRSPVGASRLDGKGEEGIDRNFEGTRTALHLGEQ
ncbi:hypothetical protein GA0115259_107461 [Streptomyces sp. MnatMP-M17]|nr:hypothetical protein GA0115259_107461 [Streptomyces sp. MnatMP-M17]